MLSFALLEKQMIVRINDCWKKSKRCLLMHFIYSFDIIRLCLCSEQFIPDSAHRQTDTYTQMGLFLLPLGADNVVKCLDTDKAKENVATLQIDE